MLPDFAKLRPGIALVFWMNALAARQTTSGCEARTHILATGALGLALHQGPAAAGFK